MGSFDFDLELQRIFDNCYSEMPPTNWKSWLDISSKEEYESLTLKQSGLSSVDNLFNRIREGKTDPRQISVNIESYSDSYSGSQPLFICHTSGTSGGKLSDLKSFHISEELVARLWAPGMQAIFQASGLDRNSSAAVFVPSRIQNDGLSITKGTKLIKLYSSEFSQRLMLSLIRPKSYLLDEYKNATSLHTIARLLSMDRISIVSAPASTVLRWADLGRLRQDFKRSLATVSDCDCPLLSELTDKIKFLGLEAATAGIQKSLSEHISGATLVFSTSSITRTEWAKIDEFMKWRNGVRNFTNLYVGSEVGPFAASIDHNSQLISNQDMQVFPLTLPVIERRGERNLISRSGDHIGRLLVSRMNGPEPVINIDTGDVIAIRSQEGLPRIAGEVLRDGFRLKTEVAISPEVGVPKESFVLVGDYFDLEEFEIINPRLLVACLRERCDSDEDVSFVLRLGFDFPWVMFVPKGGKCRDVAEIRNKMRLCPRGEMLEIAMKKVWLHLELLERNPVERSRPRSELLKRVSNGELPKGVLKNWPLYVVTPPRKSTR